MKLTTTILAVLGACLFAAPAFAGGRHFLNAYDLQTICTIQNGIDSPLSGAQCKGYVEGVVDTAYGVTGCEITLSTLAVVTPLAEFFQSTTDEQLQNIAAAEAVLFILGTRTAAGICFGSAAAL